MEIQSFIAKAMMKGYSYEDSWQLLEFAIKKGLFDKMDICSDESSFPNAIESLAGCL